MIRYASHAPRTLTELNSHRRMRGILAVASLVSQNRPEFTLTSPTLRHVGQRNGIGMKAQVMQHQLFTAPDSAAADPETRFRARRRLSAP
jgi:hypothetical protein